MIFIEAIKKRFKNYGFCVSFFALIPLLCQMFDIELPLGEWETMINALLSFLVAAGIVNNPLSDNKGYGDDAIEG